MTQTAQHTQGELPKLALIGRMSNDNSDLLITNANETDPEDQQLTITVGCADPDLEKRVARLIATAPEMLKVLERAAKDTKGAQNYHWYDQAIAVIAAAKAN